MPTCTFCKKKFKEPRGLTIFTFDGKSTHYCSSNAEEMLLLEEKQENSIGLKKVLIFSAGKEVSEEKLGLLFFD